VLHDLGTDLGRLWVALGIGVEIVALLLIPWVLLRRKEPSSTAAWLLALIFLPGLGATLFLLFGRDRLRFPAQRKRESDKALARRAHHRHGRPSEALREAALSRLDSPVERELFRVAAALGGAVPSTGNRAALLVDGNATFEAIGRAIGQAQHHVHAEYYLVRRGETADTLRDQLVAAARRGVAVRLLLDGYGSFFIGRRWIRSLREAGVRVAFFLPARLMFFQPMNLRNHRKIVVVDDALAFTGGINVGDEYRGKQGPWRDTHVALEGPAAAALARVFEQDWHFATREVIVAHPPGDPHPEKRGEATVAVVRSGPDIPGTERETIHRVFFGAITIARRQVHITTPYFIPDRAMIVALQTAALRGVDVKILLPRRSNHPVVAWAGRSFYAELLESGVEIWEYGPGMIHAKTMVVDGAVALVGSANMDLRSFRLNFEVHAVIRDDDTAARLEDAFIADLAVSERLDPVAFAGRPWPQRVVEGAARLLSPLM
jgi:cardiolipin synthase